MGRRLCCLSSVYDIQEGSVRHGFQNIYAVSKISEADNSKVAFLPVTADCGDGVKVTILESDLENYPGMFVLADPKDRALKADFAEYPEEYAVNSTRAMKYVTKRSNDIARCQVRVLSLGESWRLRVMIRRCR